MHYKTIVLELLQDRPELHNQLRKPADAAADAGKLRQPVEDQPRSLEGTTPEGEVGQRPSQIASEALEFALQELVDCLPGGSRRTTTNRFRSTQR